MTPQMRLSQFLFLLPVAVARLSAAEFSAQVVDGLNRPIPGAQVEVDCVSAKKETTSLRFQSDQNGMVHGAYDAALCAPLFVTYWKQGYGPYSAGVRSRYVLRRKCSAQEVLGVVKLEGDNRQRALRELLAGEFSSEWSQFRDLVFHYEARLRGALRTLARDPEITERARDMLSMIGVPEDLHLIMQLASPPAPEGFQERWRYAVAAALVSPLGEDEWSFLRRCALNEFGDNWVFAGSIQTLQLNGSPRSRRILEEALKMNPAQASRIASALDYIKSNPAAFVDAKLEALAKRVAQVIKLGTWEGNGVPRFNESGDKALVDFTFQTSMDLLVYTATFHKIDGVWTLRGARETYQAFAPRAPAPRKQ
jgi:hypothetical protein